ncbi:MAG TPA: methyltransferase domain-containing protein [Arenimonas sp.]
MSWYRPHLETSLGLLQRAGLSPGSRVIDVGAGASTLVDDLVALGVAHVTVLDLSAKALSLARARVGERVDQVTWLPGDLLTVPLPRGGFDLWHDRAVLHFLTDAGDALRYAQRAAEALRPGGYAVIGGFAPDGPERCSGLTVARRSPEEVAALLGPEFRLLDSIVAVALKEGAELTDAELTKAITDAGYTVVAIRRGDVPLQAIRDRVSREADDE